MANELLFDEHTPQATIATPHLDLSKQPAHHNPGRRGQRVLRVLHVVNGEHFSGAERVQTHLARCLPEFGVSVDFACLTPDRFPKHFDVETSQLFDMKMRNRWDIAAARRVAKLARDGNYQLLHAHTPRSAMIAAYASRQARRPWVYHVHSPAAADSTRPIQNRINAMTERFCLFSVSHQIAVSNSLREHTIGCGFDAANVSTVHNGVPTIRPPRTEFPQVGGVWTLGIVALHRPRKGLETLLDAQRIVRDAGYDVRLRCVGPFETPAYEASIRSRIDELQLGPDVEFTGFVDDIPAALAQLDAMVLPSLFGEGLPMVVLEAMAAAVPVIATRVEGTPEAIRHDHEGLLAAPNDPADLAAQITRLVSGEVSWHELAESASERHAAEFSDMAMARGVADVYNKVVDR
ncbi:N,N'-diacetylbacillosaminyl-diphospho-undecaprenol alpha-1,3-N-acetylgalactosaminyltransferase [Rosistilla ulvae]|uniref:N, N'-diacetylbacillosaminyl-diphospho-undecaprenol alpha-1,3-N-acetylgalactosaminyltransferase n=1 Tax=Rosistilla ulvae TaxID=1930277 RepID=A0A517M392_9BACT|nr:glycosyltransferase [Rosistilla ulvae]QDS89319.1 N,N'-diacetylbacillosaminyl-diphospho-undecaprenol alpha-1,3-N-acetylgalactosaminyltransferase [Rosistilla ulvae]